MGTRTIDPPRGISAVLQTLVKRIDREQQLDAYRLWEFWDDEVGAAIAARARPAAFRNGVLLVYVENHAWLQELRFMKDDIRNRLNARLTQPLVQEVSFLAGELPPSPRPAAPAAVRLRGTAAIALPDIDDDAIRAAFERLVAARARRLAADRPAPRRRTPRPPD